MTTRRSPLLLLALFVIGRFGVADAQPLQPYDLYDPCHPCQSKQWTSWIQYADHSDEYLVAYPGEFSTLTFGYGSILRMDPDGNYLGSKIITTMTGVSDVSLAYNPDDDQFLFVWRTTATNVYAAYLDGDGDPVAGLWKGVDGINRAYIYLGTGGNLPKVAYSKTAGKYLVVFNKPPGIIPSRLIDGDSSNAMPVLDSDFVTTINGTAASVAAGSDRFMVGYVNFSSNSDVYGRFVDNNGTPGQNFAVATHPLGVQNPVVGYHSGIDRFIISYSTWAAQPPDIGVRVINPANGAATNTFTLAFTSAWEINGGISYNPVTDTVVFSWSHGDDFFPASYTREYIVSDTENTPVGPQEQLTGVLNAVQNSAARTNPAQPQVATAFKERNGGEGVFVGILNINPPPPDETAPAAAVISGVEGPGAGQVTINWNAPGDDDNTGTADTYDLRYSLSMPFDFDTATPVAGVPSPAAAGTPQSAIISGLPDEVAVYVGLKTSDEVPNTSPLSNVAVTNTPGVPPAAVDDLVASSPSADTATLSWTSTGDDGNTGTATSYDARYATFPLNESNFDSGIPLVGEPAPAPAGTPQNFVATGLPPESTVYFAIEVIDDAGIRSVADTGSEPFVTTVDFQAPSAVGDLTATTGGGDLTQLPAPAIDSSGALFPAANATDSDEASFWSTPGRNTQVVEYITVDTGADHNIGRVRLLSRNAGSLFPEDVEIQLSSDNVNFSTVHTEIGLSADKGIWHELDFPGSMGRYMRVNITKTRMSGGGQFFAQIAEIETFEKPVSTGSVSLSWTAPGDNLGNGMATAYDLRWSLSNITDGNFGGATPVSPGEIPVPQTGGTEESTVVTGLPPESLVYFALKTTDEVPNISPLSNVVAGNTPGVAPAAVDDLVASNPTGTTVDLDWTAVGDDGESGTATEYDLRYSTSPLNAGNFDAATRIIIPAPAPAGTPESYTATGLTPGTMLYFALKVSDELGNWSPIHTNGNVTSTTLDIAPPAAITDLAATLGPGGGLTLVPGTAIDATGALFPFTNATDGADNTAWSSLASATQVVETITVDLGQVRNVGEVRLLSRNVGSLFPEDVEIRVSTDNVNFSIIGGATGLPVTKGFESTIPVTPTMGRYVQVAATKTRISAGNQYFAQIAEIDVYEAPPLGGTATLNWTSPGDDGNTGLASAYDIRWSTSVITNGNFGSATPLAPGEIPTPQIAGSAETTNVAGLPVETMIYFAIKAVDEVPNTSDLSNVATSNTEGVAPDPIDDFSTANPTGTTIDLLWTAVGDDGDTGTAAEYDFRVSLSEITAANFDAATQITIPAPAPAGTPESHTVTGLTPDTLYFFAIKVRDELNNWSPIQTTGVSPLGSCGGTSCGTLDIIAPDAIADLAIQGGTGPVLLNGTATDSSGDLFPKTNATDGNTSSFWSTPGRNVQVDEFITVDLGESRSVGEVRLLSRSAGSLFPEDLEIQLSADDVSYSTVDSAVGLPATQGLWHTFNFPSTSARYVRIYITKTRLSAGNQYFAQIAEIEVYEITSGDTVSLMWTAPGDDGSAGMASFFDLRYSTSVIDTNGKFDVATPVTGEPAPLIAGSEQTMSFIAPQEGITLHFAIKAVDDSGNSGGLSNDLEVTTTVVAPGAVTDLVATNLTSTTADLFWSASGDSGFVGTADHYEVRYSTSPITEGNFGSATLATGIPTPSAPGTPESMTVTGLSPSSSYFFALKVFDETGADSPLSNVVTGPTQAPDTTAPGDVTDLAGGPPFDANLIGATAVTSSGDFTPKTRATDGDLLSYWSSPGRGAPTEEFITVDGGFIQDFTRVRLRSRSAGALFPEDVEILVSDDNASFTSVTTRTGLPATTSTWHTIDFPPTSGRYIQVKATKTRMSAGGQYYAQIAEIELYQGGFIPGPVTLSWTAPGDDGVIGVAADYELRWSSSPITPGNFGSATEISIADPSVAGTVETAALDTLPAESTVYIALVTKDEVPNTSNLSNVLMVDTPGTPPAAVDDLNVDSTTGSTADLSWTATGDDGTTGTASSYDLRWSTSPIDASNFDAATVVPGVSSPQASGQSESHTVTGLPNQTPVYFAIKVVDDFPLTSPINTNLPVMGTTLDAIDPDAVSTLAVAGFSSSTSLAAAPAVDSSGQQQPHGNATDGSEASYWSTPGRNTQQDEFITVDLGSVKDIGQVRLLSRSAGSLFPEDLRIQVSDTGTGFVTVHTAIGLSDAKGLWHDFDLATSGRYVRIYVDKTRLSGGGQYFAQIAEIEVYESGAKDGLLINWDATGDDGSTGLATSYDLRYSTSPINAGNFNAATQITTGTPQAPGTQETATLDGLSPGTYYVAIKVLDDAGNASGLSNLPSETIP